MAHVIGNFGVFPKAGKKTQILSCMKSPQEQLKNIIRESQETQRRINKAAKERVRLDYEIKKRDEKLKYIDLIG
jgi:hypothetical protein